MFYPPVVFTKCCFSCLRVIFTSSILILSIYFLVCNSFPSCCHLPNLEENLWLLDHQLLPNPLCIFHISSHAYGWGYDVADCWTTMKSCVDTANASRCGEMVEWHQSKALVWLCKRGRCRCWSGVFSFSRRMRKERTEGWCHGTMEFIEIKSKKEHTKEAV